MRRARRGVVGAELLGVGLARARERQVAVDVAGALDAEGGQRLLAALAGLGAAVAALGLLGQLVAHAAREAPLPGLHRAAPLVQLLLAVACSQPSQALSGAGQTEFRGSLQTFGQLPPMQCPAAAPTAPHRWSKYSWQSHVKHRRNVRITSQFVHVRI